MSQSEVNVDHIESTASIPVIEPRKTADDLRNEIANAQYDPHESSFDIDAVANDDDVRHDRLAEPPAEPAGRWTNFVPLQYFFAGAFLTSVVIAAAAYGATQWELLTTFDVAAGVVVLLAIGWLVVLVSQNNRLIADYRASEVNRVYPHRVIAASRTLSNQTAEMENRLRSYSGFIADATQQIHSEAGKLNQGFQEGAEEVRQTLTQWDKARHEFSARFNVIKTHIDESRMAIEAAVQRLPVEAKRTTEDIIVNFDGQMAALIKNLQTAMATEDKFATINEKLLGAGKAIEILFADFERNFANRVNDIQPPVLDTINKSADKISLQMSKIVSEIDRNLKDVMGEIRTNNEVFLKQIPDRVEAFKVDSQSIIKQFSDVIGDNSKTVLETISREKAEFEDKHKQALIALKEYLGDLSKDIKDATTEAETNFDGFLEKFNFNFMGKLNFFSELIESKTHTFSDQMLDEIELLKKNFADLAATFSQVIETSMMSFDRRAEYTTVEFENHLSGMISKSLANIATRLDIFEEQVTARIGKMGGAVTNDPNITSRRPNVPSRYNNDYLSILEQQMSDIHQALYDLKKGPGAPPRK